MLVQRFSDSSFTLIPGDVEAAEEIHCSNMLIVTSSMEEEVVYKKRSLNIVPIIKRLFKNKCEAGVDGFLS